jgi:hypothetical protein
MTVVSLVLKDDARTSFENLPETELQRRYRLAIKRLTRRFIVMFSRQ